VILPCRLIAPAPEPDFLETHALHGSAS
jgi:hypothetical protein